MLHSLLVTVALCSTTGTIMGFHESSQACMHHLKFIPCPADPDVRIDRLVPPWLGSPWYSIPVERYSYHRLVGDPSLQDFLPVESCPAVNATSEKELDHGGHSGPELHTCTGQRKDENRSSLSLP